MNPEITMVDGWGAYGPSPKIEIIKRTYLEEEQYVTGSVTYSEGIHDDVNRFAVLQFAQSAHKSSLDVAKQYANEWLNLNDADANLVGNVITGLGTYILRNRAYLSYEDGANNPLADKRLKTLIEVRERNDFLKNNYRYWLLLYRALYESFSVVEGSYTVKELVNELMLARQQLIRLEPEYGKHINNLSRWEKPDLSPWNWPRTYSYAWKRENDFIEN